MTLRSITGGALGGIRDALGTVFDADRRDRPPARPVPPRAPLRLPEPATAAARAGRLGAPDSPLLVGMPGSPEAIRELLSGVIETLLMEGAHAAVRGDERNAGTLVWLADFTADARDAITDAD
jgi:hypothetical protein